jgi:hypothetical protein
MNDITGCGRDRPRRPRRRRGRVVAAVTVMAAVALLTAACGGDSPSAATGTVRRQQRALNYAKCMRAHGVPNFPDPNSQGDFPQFHSDVSKQVSNSADNTCHHLLTQGGGQMSAAQEQHARSQLVKYAECIRAHGVPNFPDPTVNQDGNLGFPIGSAHINIASPQYKSADQVCKHFMVNAKGGGS